jgi:hypothetical protein
MKILNLPPGDMQTFTTSIKKFGAQGEKTGWSYLDVPADIAEKLKPGCKKSYRVKGKLDDHRIEKVSLIPMGGGSFIIPLNAAMRKAIGKNKGAMVKLQLSEDGRNLEIAPELIECLKDEPGTLERFNKQPGSHQRYFSKWVSSAKTEQTKAKRIAMTVQAMMKGFNYAEMMREFKNKDF